MKQLTNLVSQFSLHVNELNSVQKEMDKLLQTQRSTWDGTDLYTQLNANSLLYIDDSTATPYNGWDNSTNASSNRPQYPLPLKPALKSSTSLATRSENQKNGNAHRSSSPPRSPADLDGQEEDEKSVTSTTATILVSKTKTKTGLPLMLKKSLTNKK